MSVSILCVAQRHYFSLEFLLNTQQLTAHRPTEVKNDQSQLSSSRLMCKRPRYVTGSRWRRRRRRYLQPM